MELRELITFRTVAQTLNFTQAAALLGYAQSSVTAQIQSLEQELGVPLFDRLGRRVVLTAAGARLLHYAEKILALASEAREVVSGIEQYSGTLTVGAPETICTYRLPAVLRIFKERFPKAHITFRPMLYREMHRGLHEGTLDAGFLLQDRVQLSRLKVETLITEPMEVIAGADHPLVGREIVTPIDLEGETLLLTESNCGYRMRFERMVAAAGVYPADVMEFNSVEAIKQCVIAGMGIAVLPRVTVAAPLMQGQLVALPWSNPFEVFTQMVWHEDRWHSPVLKGFLDTSREVLGTAVPESSIQQSS